ncbi:uncharacterized protein UTRI_04877 [Ustilago trichophora]|uniref:Uncharacterized protein n=1 Tax=Ustilago trichophora TaxID=86804 RepID=A0A5C3EE49_9BASI|nr:uncharacterized protein UTRI_04877 [Ustilago trichophora]
MVKVFFRVILPACLVIFSTLAWALEKRADDGVNLDLGLAPPAPLTRSASAGPSVPMRTSPAPRLRLYKSFDYSLLAQARAEYGKMLTLAPSSLSPGQNTEPSTPVRSQESPQGTSSQHPHGVESDSLWSNVHHGRPVPPAPLHDLPPKPKPQSSWLAPYAQPESPVRSGATNMGGEGEPPQFKRKDMDFASSSSTSKKKAVKGSRIGQRGHELWRMSDPQGNLFGQRGARDIPASLGTSMSRGGPSSQSLQSSRQDSILSHGHQPVMPYQQQLDRANALAQWGHYKEAYFAKPFPRFIHGGAFLPRVGEELQQRIDQLNAVKKMLLKHTTYDFSQEELKTLKKPFYDWRGQVATAGGFQVRVTQRILDGARNDQKLLGDVESILRKIAPSLSSGIHR